MKFGMIIARCIAIVALMAGMFAFVAQSAHAGDIMPPPRGKLARTAGDIMPGPR